MTSDFKYKLRIYTILISVLLIITLQMDYFVIKELWIESSLNVGLSILLLFNIIRQISSTLYSIKFLSYSVNLLLTVIGIYCISILLFIYWGYGFTGKEIPFIWVSAFVLSLLQVIVVFVELRNLK
jgi:hypothetical protein